MSDLAKSKKPFFNTRTLVSCAMLAACAVILIELEISLPFIAPPFYKFDFSELPALIGAFSMGPVAGVIIELIKVLVKLITTTTMGIGELANFVLGCIFIVPAAIIYKKKKTKKRAVIGVIVGSVLMSVLAVFINAFIMIPLYASLFEMPVETIIQMGAAIFPFIDSMFDFCLACVLPFNLIKVLLVSAITMFIYKPLSILIKGISNY
ncbi:MAG: ECF transporter S component [Ruminococcus sp.]|nr:ECF transporter S component [Ruminococcus sp.]